MTKPANRPSGRGPRTVPLASHFEALPRDFDAIDEAENELVDWVRRGHSISASDISGGLVAHTRQR